MKLIRISIITLLFQIAILSPGKLPASGLSDPTLNVLPYPQEVIMGGESFTLSAKLSIVIDKNASVEDRFAASELARNLKRDFNLDASVTTQPSEQSLVLSRNGADKRVGQEGYQLNVAATGIQILANTGAGLFYGTQTLQQLIQSGKEANKIPGMKITDWPSIKERAAHYDTKHHQDKKEYVEGFIRDLARYKINILMWEWEDKFAYPSHPEIGAPGAFTMAEMQAFTNYARQYHVQIVPLVQGLGHVSFILKWPQYASLREIPSSNWEFCPLRKESYDLLFDLWDDAIKATPGSNYIHIGSDETYELAACEGCKAKAKEIGKSGVYLSFVNKVSQHLKPLGRSVMVWEPPLGWEVNDSPARGVQPQKGLVLTESYGYETGDFNYARKAKLQGFKVYAYDPNPGTEPFFLPYNYKEDDDRKKVSGSLHDSFQFLKTVSNAGIFDGLVCTSWDDSGLHNQVWMLRFAAAGALSWNGKAPALDDLEDIFLRDYYGMNAKSVKELFLLMNEGAYYFLSTFERKVWHYGDVGKTHLPDLPRGFAMEFDLYWNKQYDPLIKESQAMEEKMQRAIQIADENLNLEVKNKYDFEIFKTDCKMIWHTTQTVKDLSSLERLIVQANKVHYEDHALAYQSLEKAAALIQNSLDRRKTIFNELVTTWEKTRLPKGLSTPEKQFFFQQDRARHFANRQPDMTFLIYDEQKLDMEGYLQKLKDYMQYYKKTFL